MESGRPSRGCGFESRAFRLMKKYNFGNFFVSTIANFVLCEIPDRAPDFYSFSGSTYWDLGDRVRRWSNHWGPKIRTCCWYLDFQTLELKYAVCGECLYEEFRMNYIDVDPVAAGLHGKDSK